MDAVKQNIYKAVKKVVEERSIDLSEIHDHDTLVDSLGLNSLDLARILAILELKLNVDPFAELVSITSVRTVGDLYSAYAKSFAEEDENEAESEDTPVNSTPVRQPHRRVPNTRQRDLRKKVRS